jgi:hypothetical protein
MMPMLDTVMRFWLMLSPSGSDSILMDEMTASILSMGSPIPMYTMLVRVSRSGSE